MVIGLSVTQKVCYKVFLNCHIWSLNCQCFGNVQSLLNLQCQCHGLMLHKFPECYHVHSAYQSKDRSIVECTQARPTMLKHLSSIIIVGCAELTDFNKIHFLLSTFNNHIKIPIKLPHVVVNVFTPNYFKP